MKCIFTPIPGFQTNKLQEETHFHSFLIVSETVQENMPLKVRIYELKIPVAKNLSFFRVGVSEFVTLIFDFDWILCNTSYEATQRVVSAQVDELIRWMLLFLGGWLLPA